MKRILIVSALVTVSTLLVAQESKPNEKVHFAYLGESILHPGIRVGYSHHLWQKIKLKKATSRFPEGKPKFQSISALYQVGFYSRSRLYFTAPITASIAYNRTGSKGFITQFALGFGYDRTFLKGSIYEVDERGMVSEKNLLSSGYFNSLYTIGFGLDMSKFQKPHPITLMLKNTILLKHGFNNATMPQWLTEIELSHLLNWQKS